MREFHRILVKITLKTTLNTNLIFLLSKILLLPLYTLSLFANQDALGQKNYSDTTFIFKDTSDGMYHMIYLETNKNSEYYKKIADFSFDKSDSLAYIESIKSILEVYPQKISKQEFPSKLPQFWCNLNLYKDSYYLYAPSDFGFNSNAILTDTSIVKFNMDGPYASIIDSIKTIDQNTFDFYLRIAYSTTEIITIHVIDWVNQIAIFDNHSESEQYRYKLMVGLSNAKRFSIVVNYSKYNKRGEFNFDPIDFSKLLKQ